MCFLQRTWLEQLVLGKVAGCTLIKHTARFKGQPQPFLFLPSNLQLLLSHLLIRTGSRSHWRPQVGNGVVKKAQALSRRKEAFGNMGSSKRSLISQSQFLAFKRGFCDPAFYAYLYWDHLSPSRIAKPSRLGDSFSHHFHFTLNKGQQ